MTNPEERRLALGDRLRELREAAGLNGKELAERIGWQPSKVSRIERARQAVTDADLGAVCRALEVEAAVAEDVRNELRAIRVEEARWSRQLRVGHRALQEQVGQAEHDAHRISAFQLTMVPGLAQTAEYARHVFSFLAEFRDTPRDTEAAVGARLERQQVLYREDKRIELLFTAFAFTNPIAPKPAMRAQADRLIALQGLPSIRLGIIPPGKPLPPAVSHSFRVIDDIVSIELINTEIATGEASDVALYHSYLEALWELAEEGDALRARLLALIDDQ